MTIVDPDGAIHGQPHGSFTDAVVGALGAEPETVEELEAALDRFITPGERGRFAGWRRGVCGEPYDAGICIVDLAARLVVLRSTYSLPGPKGQVLYRDRENDTGAWLPYHVSDDWAFSDNVEAWEGLAQQRRDRRAASPPIDARAALYGRVCEFIVDECFAVRGEGPAGDEWKPPEAWTLRELPERVGENETPKLRDAAAEIHARWLMTPRADLGAQSPRDVLLAKHDYLGWDLQDRCHQWSMLGDCPPGLSRQSAAFRFAGFGTHEHVLYYDLVRHLVWECLERVVAPEGGDAQPMPDKPDEVARLERAKGQWLGTPDWEDLSGRTPRQVIERERMRLPMAVSGEEAMVDEDCPLCQMMAEGPGPVFWHLDGCNMDDDFPFSFERTREEWEEERRSWEEHFRRCEEERKLREAGQVDDPWPGAEADSPSVWRHSFTSPDVGGQPPSIVLFGIGSHLAELGEDLAASPETAPIAQSLNRQFGNLRAAIGDPGVALVEPVIARFCEELQAAVEVRPDLAEKCADLERQLHEFAARLAPEEDWEEDLPF